MIFLVLLCATPAAAAPISCDACLSSAKGCSQKKQDVWVMRTLVPHIEEGAKFFIDLAANGQSAAVIRCCLSANTGGEAFASMRTHSSF